MTSLAKFRKILVTGGLGFIGSHIVDRLLDKGFDVTILDNFSSGKIKNIDHNQQHEGLEIVKGDIRDLNLVKKTINGVDIVFHEAALASVSFSVQNPILTNDVNVSGTLNLLQAAADLGVKRFIFASSAAVYGDTGVPKKKENNVLSPRSPYAVSKLAGEKYARSFYELYGLETVALRYFNVYGPRQNYNPRAQYGGVITIFLNQLLNNQSPTIYGDGEQTRDFVFVDDVVQANLLALESKNAIGEFFNIGSGKRTSVNRVAQTLKDKLDNREIENAYLASRPGDLKNAYADISKAKKMLNYIPRVSLEEGIESLVDWYTMDRRLTN